MSNRPLSSVYVSYRHEGKSKRVIERLKQACDLRGIALNVDDNSIGYRDSIRGFMCQLGAGKCIIVVLSDEYLKSKSCMFELLEIEKNEDIREQIFPIILRGTRIDDAEDRVPFVDYWDEKIAALQAKLTATKSQAHLPSIHRDLDLYSDIRRAIDGLMDLLGDMYCPDQDVHLKTNFAAVLDAIQGRLASSPPLPEPGPFRPGIRKRIEGIQEKVVAGIQAELNRLLIEALRRELIQQLSKRLAGQTSVAGPDAPARLLCALNVEDALRLLHIAAHASLATAGLTASQSATLRKAALNILGWLLLSVKDEWVRERQAHGASDDTDLELRIPVETEVGTEVLVARLQGSPASFECNDTLTRVFGSRHVTGASFIPEAGFGVANTVEEVKRAIWKAWYKGELKEPWTSDHDKALSKAFMMRRDVGERYYITVRLSDASNSLRGIDVSQAIRHDLHLQVVILESGQGDEVLLIPERPLISLITEFLRTLRKTGDA
jgi:hypothetical protein